MTLWGKMLPLMKVDALFPFSFMQLDFVALNPTYRIFLNFAKSCVLSCLSNGDNIKKFTVLFLNYKLLKL